ncbi:hypothetical protein [Leucobacter soli]|uniref:hypothetical protein n=1 Tax=Leucobacter soli TaxID=2812850 RepID=UPI003619EC54
MAALALVGGIAGPAHAEAGGIAGSTPAQDAAESGVTAVPTETTDTGAPGTPAGENVAETLRLETERAVAAMKSARKAEAKKNSTVSKKRKAALKKAAAKQKAAVKKKATKAKKKLKKVVRSAMSQLGDFQDCTAVVERALRKAGVHAGDLGTQVGDYTELGGRKVTGKYRAGDVLIWPGRHVAVYTGKGKAVHGGWNGGRTVVNKNLQVYSKPIVVRYFKADQQAAASVAS